MRAAARCRPVRVTAWMTSLPEGTPASRAVNQTSSPPGAQASPNTSLHPLASTLRSPLRSTTATWCSWVSGRKPPVDSTNSILSPFGENRG